MALPDRDYVKIAHKYARDVIAGRIPACKWVRKAAQRHLNDLKRDKANDPTWPYYFAPDMAARPCKFMERLHHTKGAWASRGERFILAPWQIFMTVVLFGWRRWDDGFRRFRRAFLLIPRKNGKSQWAAGLGLYMLCADGEFGAEVYAGATSEKQAWEVFRPARLMALRNTALLRRYKADVTASNVHIDSNNSRFEPIIGNPGDGSSPSCAIHDEYHEHDTDAQVDAMQTGMGARDQPLQLIISTAGVNIAGPCYGAQLELQRVLDGTLENEELFGCIWTVDEGDDWTTDAALIKANPNIDVSVKFEFLKSAQKAAIASARKQGIFQTKHLNKWVSAKAAYFNLESGISAGDPELKIEDFTGQQCFIGLDLATKIDLAALCAFFPTWDANGMITGGAMFWKYYAPEATVEAPENEHYQTWEIEGWLTVNEGSATDFEAVREDINILRSEHQVDAVFYDPNQATYFAQTLVDQDGAPMVEYKQNTLNLSDPMKQWDALMREKKIKHQGDPITNWCVSNVVSKPNAKEEEFPRKERPENKIDGGIAGIIALGGAQSYGLTGGSVYANRGLATVG